MDSNFACLELSKLRVVAPSTNEFKPYPHRPFQSTFFDFAKDFLQNECESQERVEVYKGCYLAAKHFLETMDV